ncbi:MAG: hypothetical protein M0Z80_10670 [Treponema sp.]|nr:hypothetical protein [Treponema sp.]
MNEGLLEKGISVWIGSAVPRSSLAVLPIGHLALCLTAFLVSYKAAAVVFAVSVVALLRYVAIAGFASSIVHHRPFAVVLDGALWLFSFAALAVVIVAATRVARAFLPWAVGAAFVGPLLATAMTVVAGVRALARACHEKGVVR